MMAPPTAQLNYSSNKLKLTDLKAVLLRRNYGQTAAMAAGFNYAWGKAVVTLDGDLHDPS